MKSWIRKLFAPRPRLQPARPSVARLAVEALERRELLDAASLFSFNVSFFILDESVATFATSDTTVDAVVHEQPVEAEGIETTPFSEESALVDDPAPTLDDPILFSPEEAPVEEALVWTTELTFDDGSTGDFDPSLALASAADATADTLETSIEATLFTQDQPVEAEGTVESDGLAESTVLDDTSLFSPETPTTDETLGWTSEPSLDDVGLNDFDTSLLVPNEADTAETSVDDTLITQDQPAATEGTEDAAWLEESQVLDTGALALDDNSEISPEASPADEALVWTAEPSYDDTGLGDFDNSLLVPIETETPADTPETSVEDAFLTQDESAATEGIEDAGGPVESEVFDSTLFLDETTEITPEALPAEESSEWLSEPSFDEVSTEAEPLLPALDLETGEFTTDAPLFDDAASGDSTLIDTVETDTAPLDSGSDIVLVELSAEPPAVAIVQPLTLATADLALWGDAYQSVTSHVTTLNSSYSTLYTLGGTKAPTLGPWSDVVGDQQRYTAPKGPVHFNPTTGVISIYAPTVFQNEATVEIVGGQASSSVLGSRLGTSVKVTLNRETWSFSLAGNSLLSEVKWGNPGGTSGGVSRIEYHGSPYEDTFTNKTAIASTAYGNGGRDTLTGGSGDDHLHGGDLDDQLFGGGGYDTLWGDAGNDTLHGQGADDRLIGGSGNDTLKGGTGHDVLWGEANDDRLFGEAGDDWLYGGANNDSLYGGDGLDELYGEEGNDGLFGGIWDAQQDILVGGGGANRFLIHADVWPAFRDHLIDLTAEDARVNFTSGYSNWSEQEIEKVDEGLAFLHGMTNNTRLLKLPNGGEQTFERHIDLGSAYGRSPAAADNNSNGLIRVGNLTFEGQAGPASVIIHEVGHNWDGANAMGGAAWNVWLSLSSWSVPGQSTFGLTSQDGQWQYGFNAQFSHFGTPTGGVILSLDSNTPPIEYGRTNPNEDWATMWQEYYKYKTGTPDATEASRLRLKLEFVEAFMASKRS